MRIRGPALAGLRAVFEKGSLAGMSDAQLLERVAEGDEGRSSVAFSALVERHGPMVSRVCRAALRDEHDAEDAFQAVFLVLLRKGRHLWVRDSLGPWLHAVAVRAASQARTQALRRKAHETKCGKSEIEDIITPSTELSSIVHEELQRLPDRYRRAVVLCDLEQLSHDEAARRLGWPVGTVKSRQARGRERLKARLRRRGITSADHAIAFAFNAAGRAFRAVGTSAAASSLAGHICRSMLMRTISLSLVSLVAAGTIATGMIALATPMFADEKPAPVAAAAAASKAPRPPAGSLLQLRIVADTKHNPGAKEGEEYRWVKLDPKQELSSDGLITKADDAGETMVLVKLNPRDPTERDLLEVWIEPDSQRHSAIGFRMTPEGAEKLGELTKSHLPEEGGSFKYQLAIIVKNVIVSMPMLNSEIRSAGIIEFGNTLNPDEIQALAHQLDEAAAYNAPSLNTKELADQAAALREATTVDIPALEKANRVTIVSAANGSRMTISDPKTVASFRRTLQTKDVPPSGGEIAAWALLSHDNDLIRKIWVYEGGEWGFARPGTSWTTGASADLWNLIQDRVK